jgi:galactokinase/mevalonate kinase-like predicted kinase
MFSAGQCLAGAGGGGFLCVIAKSPEMAQKVKDTLGNNQVRNGRYLNRTKEIGCWFIHGSGGRAITKKYSCTDF